MAQQAKLHTINIKGKQYTQVFTRINFFRGSGEDGLVWEGGKGKNWGLSTEILESTPEHVLCKAVITNENDKVMATGHAREIRKGNINVTSCEENAETSAVGRALGNLGIGTAESFASTDEVNIAIAKEARQELAAAQAEIKRLKAGGASSSSDASTPQRKVLNGNWVERYINEMLEKSKLQEIDETLVRFVQHSSDERYLGESSPEYLDTLKNAQVSELSCIIPVEATQHVVKAHTEAVQKQAKSTSYANVLKALMDADQVDSIMSVFSHEKTGDCFTAALKMKVAGPLSEFLDKHKVPEKKQQEVFPFLSPSTMKVIKASQKETA